MAFTKAHLYAENDQITSHLAKAIFHPARIQIIRKLHKHGTCTVEDLSELHPITQPSISQHLRILRKVHLVTCIEKFPYTYYSLDKEMFRKFKKHLMIFLKTI